MPAGGAGPLRGPPSPPPQGAPLSPAPEQIKFSFQLTPEERAAEQKRYLRLIAQARTAAGEIPDGLLVLDEVCAAVNAGLLPLEEVLSCLEAAACEVVLTGRDPAPELLARADYVTEMKKLRHPYDRGTAARQGVEW